MYLTFTDFVKPFQTDIISTWINKSFLEYFLLSFTSDSIALWQITVHWITHDHDTTIPLPVFEHVWPPPVVRTSFLEDVDLWNEHKKSLRSAVALTILFNFLTGRLDSFLGPIKGWERKRCYTCTCIGVSLRAEHQANRPFYSCLLSALASEWQRG